MDIREKLLAIFQAEHAEHLQNIRSFLALQEGSSALPLGADPPAPSGEDLDDAFREAHSLKGAARAVDLPSVEGLAHRLETLFARVRERVLVLDGRAIGVIHQVLDSSEDFMASLAENITPPEPFAALSAIDAVLGDQQASYSPGLGSESSAAPPPPSPRFRSVAKQPAPTAADVARVRVQDLDRLVRSTAQLLAETMRQGRITEQLNRITREVSDLETEWERFRKKTGSQPRSADGHRNSGQSARYFDAADQKLRSLARQSRTTALLQRRSAWSSRSLSELLQRDVWTARMVSARSFLDGFGRMVRDLAGSEGKQIDFRVKGFDVRADRAVLQALKDPVMHLLRNAISHGVEKPEERTAAGKPATGSIAILIHCEQHQLIIQVEDDGRGIDLERVGESGVRQGIISDSERLTRTPAELANIIFQPGLSTSETVTHLSGRGMGLSVVLEAARQLQGNVALGSKSGPGTSIVISVPLSVATSQLLLVSCEEQTFAVPIHGICRLYRVPAANVETVRGQPSVTLEQRHFPLYSLRSLLGIGEAAPTLPESPLPIMLLKSGVKYAAVMVDGFLSERDALVQDVGIPGMSSPIVAGAMILDDGTATVVLNTAHLLERCGNSDAPTWNTAAVARNLPKHILIVDDSMTTSLLEKSILEAHGYRVRVAVDGLEALRLLHEEKSDVVITDIEMPRMDGFGLLQSIKGDKDLNQIPVIIVSSIERKEDQQRGLALGADAYIVKCSFDQKELLEVIQQVA